MTYISRFSDFALSLKDYLMNEHDSLMVQYDRTFDLKIKVDHFDLYFTVQ